MRIVSLLVGINAALGIATAIGVRIAINKTKKKARIFFDSEEENKDASS